MKPIKLALLILLLSISGVTYGKKPIVQGEGLATQVEDISNFQADDRAAPEVGNWNQDSNYMKLLGWASHLSSYSRPQNLPSVRFKDHSFFVHHACGGQDCNVLGWYNDTGIVYLDSRLREQDSVFKTIQLLL